MVNYKNRHLVKRFGSGALAPPKKDEAKATFPSFARTLLYFRFKFGLQAI